MPEYLVGHGSELLQAATEQGLEGVLAKRLESRYQPGRRTGDWVKVKRPGRQEFVIGGWLPGKGSRSRRIGALLLGVYESDGSLRYAGRAGQRLQRARARPSRRPAGAPGTRELARSRAPVPPRESVFCEPRLVAEVSFSEWTPDGRLRHPVYLGLREDKPAREVVREDAPMRERRRTPRDRQRRSAAAAQSKARVSEPSGAARDAAAPELRCPQGWRSSPHAPARPSPTSKAAS